MLLCNPLMLQCSYSSNSDLLYPYLFISFYISFFYFLSLKNNLYIYTPVTGCMYLSITQMATSCLGRVIRDSSRTEHWGWSLVAPSPPPGHEGLATGLSLHTHALSFPKVSPHPLPSTSLQSFLFSLHSTSSSCRHAGSEVFLQEGEVHVLTTGWYRKVDNLIAKCCTASWHETDVLMTACSLGRGESNENSGQLRSSADRKSCWGSAFIWALLRWQY